METGITKYKPNSAVAARREMAKVPAVMEALEPIERSVFLASTGKTVAEYDARELSVELAKALKYIAKDVGFRDTDESERGYLVVRVAEILKRYYSGLTLKDFRMAFEMSITGELDEYLPKGRDGQADRGHYQQFNAEYVCKILNAYKYRRAAVLKRAYDAVPKDEEPRNPELERRIHNEICKDCVAAFEFFRENGYMPGMSPTAEMLYYQLLSDAGLAPEIAVTIEEQQAIFQRAIVAFTAKGLVGDMKRLKEIGPNAPELQHGAFEMARRRALAATFSRMAEQGINITDYIKFE